MEDLRCISQVRIKILLQEIKSINIAKAELDKISSVEILVDKSSVEVFVNNGEYVFTTRFYPQKDSLAVEAAGAEIMMEEIR